MNNRRAVVIRAGQSVFALLAMAVALSGCGFHLQGASPLPAGVDAMNITYHNDYQVGDPPLVTTLRARLRERGLLSDSHAGAQLDIETIDNDQRVVSISPIDGLAAEYALRSKVVFDYRANGGRRLDNQTLSVTRDYSINDTQRLAAESERRDLLIAMHQDLADLILLRIAQFNHRAVSGRSANGQAINDRSINDHAINDRTATQRASAS